MRSSNAVFLLCPLILVLQSCCSTKGTWGGTKPCCPGHEGPLELADGLPSPGLVIGTVDFTGSGSVLIKIQVEDLSIPDGNTATVTGWAGAGSHPASTDLPPASSSQFYTTFTDTTLRHWTTHIDRAFDSSAMKYWVVVRVVHSVDGVPQTPVYLWREWTPTSSSIPDEPHQFYTY